MVCNPSEHWSSCSQKVLLAIEAAKTPEEAVNAANEWALRYKRLQAAHESQSWMATDQQRMEDAGGLLFDEAIGKYLDPAAIAFELALARYLPGLAAAVGLLTNPWVIAFYAILAPSPIANEFTQAGPTNKEINGRLLQKIETFMPIGWRDNYLNMLKGAYLTVKPGNPGGLP